MRRVVLLVFFLLAIPVHAALAGPGGDVPPEARRALHEARTLLDGGRPAEAARVLEVYLAATAETPPVGIHQVLGVALGEAGQPGRALAACQAGLDRFPDDTLLTQNAAVLLHKAGDNAGAAPLFERAYALERAASAASDTKKSDPARPDPELLAHAATCWLLAGRHAEAARAAQALLDVAGPTSGSVRTEWLRLAVHAFLGAKQLDRAETVVLKLLRVEPGEAQWWELLARVNLDRERWARAAAALEAAYALKTPEPRELEQLAGLYRYAGAPLLAAAALERIQGVDPERLAALYASAARTQRAVRALDAGKPNPESLLAQGRVLLRARELPGAGEALDECLRAAPANAEARLLRGLCAWEARDWPRAREEFSLAARSKALASRAASALRALDDLARARMDAEAP
ncbi:MAG: tetratricopeptide repeat protein [Desulfovibrionaceae bacterium]